MEVLAKRPEVTYSELAKEIGIGRATLYRHFPERADLFRAISLYSLRLVEEQMKPVLDSKMNAMDTLYAALAILVPMGEKFHFLSRELAVMQEEEVARQYQDQLDALQQLIRVAKREGGIAADVPDAWIVRVFDILIYTAWEAMEAGDIARNDAVRLVYRTMFTGFGNAPEG